MSSTTAQSLRQATASTFEELTLLFPEAELSEEQGAAPWRVAVAVDFRGPFHGRLVLRASDAVLPHVAANMLGDDAAGEPPLQRDALGEVANVVCGNVLPVIGGRDAVFHLAAPQVVPVEAPAARPGDEPEASVCFGIEEGRVEALLYTFGAVPAHG